MSTLRVLSAISIFLLPLVPATAINRGSIHVKDFKAFPDDDRCDKEAIQAAIDYAIGNQIRIIEFEAGRYDLRLGSAAKLEDQETYVQISGVRNGLKLQGQTDEQGLPATLWVRENPCNTQSLPSILYTYDSEGLTLENLRFDNDPYYNSAGKVVESREDYVVVDVFADHPLVDGMESCQLGVYDLGKGELVDGKIGFHSSGQWKKIPGGSGRLMKLTSEKAAERTKPGDGLFWFFTTSGGRQLFFDKSKDVILKNLWTSGSSGFCYYFRHCRNVIIEKLAIKPGEGQITTAPRDGLHFRECSGIISIRDLEIEGTNDDGINVHGQFHRVEKRESGKRLRIKAWNESSAPIPVNTRMGFFDGAAIEHFGNIRSYSYDPSSNEHILEFVETLPDWITTGTECVPYGMMPDSVTITNASFKNIATCGIIIKTDNTTLDNCYFYNVERVGAFVLCSFHDPSIGMMEPSAARNVLIRNSIFDNCGRKLRAGGMGGLAAVATDVGRRDGASIENIRIISNTFKNMINNCINIMDARDVVITENRFEGIPKDRQVYVDAFSENVTIYNNSN